MEKHTLDFVLFSEVFKNHRGFADKWAEITSFTYGDANRTLYTASNILIEIEQHDLICPANLENILIELGETYVDMEN